MDLAEYLVGLGGLLKRGEVTSSTQGGVGEALPPGLASNRAVASLMATEGVARPVPPEEPGMEPGGAEGGLLAAIALRRLASKSENSSSTFPKKACCLPLSSGSLQSLFQFSRFAG